MNEEIKVLALKYRPKRFEDLVGQSTISQTLSLALDSNRLSHAYLFSGLRGSGKTSTARIMAKAFLCSQGPTSKPCEVCENCMSANTNRHLDIIEMDAASNRGIDDIKDLIEHTKYKPSSARFKVFIIDEVHMLTTQAFNALLKTLEEPPGFVKFILATTDPLKLPATILSRTQHFRFKKIANKDVIHHLMHILNEEKIEFESEALDIISRSGQGSLRDTLTLLDQAIIFAKGKVTTVAVVDMLGLIDPKFMDEIFDIVLNKEDTIGIVSALEEYEAGQVCDEMTIYLKQKMLERSVKFDTLLFDRFFRILADAKHLLSLNSDPSFVMLLMLSKMSESVNLKTIDEVISEIEAIEVKETQKVCHDSSLTQAIQEKTVVTHSREENKSVVVPVVQEVYHEEKSSAKPEPVISPEVSISDFSTPFDEPSIQANIEPTVDNHVQEEIIQREVVVEEIATDLIQQIPTVDAHTQERVEPEPNITLPLVQEEPTIEPVPTVQPQLTEETPVNQEHKKQFELVINRVYDRDIELGEAFEDNFFFQSFDGSILMINSVAQGDTRKFLLKHYGLIKTFFYDVFGNNIELKFETQANEKKSDEVKEKIQPQEINVPESQPEANNNSAGSMIEDIEMGSGCVADMQKTANPVSSQQELQIDEVLNSPMIKKAEELFAIKKIKVKTKT